MKRLLMLLTRELQCDDTNPERQRTSSKSSVPQPVRLRAAVRPAIQGWPQAAWYGKNQPPKAARRSLRWKQPPTSAHPLSPISPVRCPASDDGRHAAFHIRGHHFRRSSSLCGNATRPVRPPSAPPPSRRSLSTGRAKAMFSTRIAVAHIFGKPFVVQVIEIARPRNHRFNVGNVRCPLAQVWKRNSSNAPVPPTTEPHNQNSASSASFAALRVFS